MTICMLVYHYYPVAAGGAERQCRLQAKALAAQGHTCRVLTARSRFSDPSQDRDGAVEVIRIHTLQAMLSSWVDCKQRFFASRDSADRTEVRTSEPEKKSSDSGGSVVRCVRWLNALCFMAGVYLHVSRNRGRIDVLHTHVASWNSGFATWLGHRFGIPVVCKASYLPAFHDFGRSVPLAGLWARWRRRGTFIALTQEMADDLVEHGVSPERIRVIPNGVCIPEERSDVERNDMVLYVGNLTQGSEHKGFDVLLAAWAHVHKALPDARLVIAGGGDASPWMASARRLDCGDSIVFLGHVADLSSTYLLAGLFVLSSRGEGISNALLEAQSYGIPAVVTDIPGNRDVVKANETGAVVAVDDASALAVQMMRLWNDPGLRRQMGESARRQMEDHFSIERTAVRLSELYQRLKSVDSQQRADLDAKRLTVPHPEWEQQYVEGKLNPPVRSFPVRCLAAVEHRVDVITHPAPVHSTCDLLACVDLLVDFDALGRQAVVVGCGPVPGVLRELADHGFSVVGIEPVREAVRQAKGFLGGAGDVQEGTAESIPLADGSQSLVLLENVLEHVDSVRKTLEECFRILKPGGVLYVLTTNRHRFSWTGVNWGFSTRFFNWFPRSVQESYVFCQLHDRPELARYSPRPAVHWFTYADLCAAGRDVGFARFYACCDVAGRVRNPPGSFWRRVRQRVVKNPWIRAWVISQSSGQLFMWKRGS